uniref:Uncharacterized protein n=1 Tax=Arundo donax TaxID=35708 RepID=A0A0A9ANW5_ARUDO
MQYAFENGFYGICLQNIGSTWSAEGLELELTFGGGLAGVLLGFTTGTIQAPESTGMPPFLPQLLSQLRPRHRRWWLSTCPRGSEDGERGRGA